MGTRNFSLTEFACPCCGENKINMSLLYALQITRNELKSDDPMVITSGYRCKKYNSSPAIGSTDTSSHVKGLAADIAIPNSSKAFRVMQAIFKTNAFTRVGFGKIKKTLVLHVDIDPSKVQQVLWGY